MADYRLILSSLHSSKVLTERVARRLGSEEVRVFQRSSAALNLELRHLKSRLYR
jgi:hypothetical protein